MTFPTGFSNGTMCANNVCFNGAKAPQVTADGQLIIGRTGFNPTVALLTAGAGIGVANGPGTITISNTGSFSYTYTPVTFVMSPYAVLGTNFYLGVNSLGGPVTVQLPNAPAVGRVYIVSDASGNSAVNAITVTTVGGIVLINGAATFPINFPYGTFSFIFNGLGFEIF